MRASPAFAALLDQLTELSDARSGLQILSHREGALGRSVVAAKVLFRRACQPFINEVLRKQSSFNDRLLTVLQTLHQDIESSGRASAASVSALEGRITKLEQQLSRLAALLEAQHRDGSPAHPPHPAEITRA